MQKKLDKLRLLRLLKVIVQKKPVRFHNLLNRKSENFSKVFWRRTQLKSIFRDF
jgi:hypothetical protein